VNQELNIQQSISEEANNEMIAEELLK